MRKVRLLDEDIPHFSEYFGCGCDLFRCLQICPWSKEMHQHPSSCQLWSLLVGFLQICPWRKEMHQHPSSCQLWPLLVGHQHPNSCQLWPLLVGHQHPNSCQLWPLLVGFLQICPWRKEMHQHPSSFNCGLC